MEKYRVWALTLQGEKWVWIPISQLFETKLKAMRWANQLNTDYRVEAEEVED